MMKLLSILTLSVILVLATVSVNVLLAQDDFTIGQCEQRCGTRTETGQIIGNYQDIARCRERCRQEFWKRVDRKDKEPEDPR
jgi:hypothetical protein